MENPLKMIGSSGTGCGTCKPTGCESCGTSPQKTEIPAALSRRAFGHVVLAASAGAMLAGCSTEKTPEIASEPTPAAPAPPALSPDLAVVQSSKGPIMTTLEEFYKMGPGPSSSHTMG